MVRLIEGESIVLRLQPPDLPVDGVWSFHIMPRWEDRCRLLVRHRLRMRVPGEAVGAEAAGPVTSLMTRGMLLGIKRRVEQSLASQRCELEHVGQRPPGVAGGGSSSAGTVPMRISTCGSSPPRSACG